MTYSLFWTFLKTIISTFAPIICLGTISCYSSCKKLKVELPLDKNFGSFQTGEMIS